MCVLLCFLFVCVRVSLCVFCYVFLFVYFSYYLVFAMVKIKTPTIFKLHLNIDFLEEQTLGHSEELFGN